MIDFGHSVYLDRFDRDNLGFIRDERNNFEIRRWCRQTNLIYNEGQDLWFDRQMQDPTIEMYGVYDNKDLEIRGVCGLTDIDQHNRRAEFSLYIFRQDQKKGFGKNALLTLFNHGFNNLNLNCIWGETFAGNPALNLFKSIGMKEEGIRREFYLKHGQYIDCHLESILLSEWKQSEYNRPMEI